MIRKDVCMISGTCGDVRVDKYLGKYSDLSVVINSDEIRCYQVRNKINTYDFDRSILSLYVNVRYIIGNLKECFFGVDGNIISKLINVRHIEFLVNHNSDIKCIILMLQKLKYLTSLSLVFYCYEDILKQTLELYNEIMNHKDYLSVTMTLWVILDENQLFMKFICSKLLTEMSVSPVIFINYDFPWSNEIDNISENNESKQNLLFILSHVIEYGFLFYVNSFA